MPSACPTCGELLREEHIRAHVDQHRLDAGASEEMLQLETLRRIERDVGTIAFVAKLVLVGAVLSVLLYVFTVSRF